MKKGLALIVVLAVLLIAGAVWWYLQNTQSQTPSTTAVNETAVPFSVLTVGENAKEIHKRTNYAIYDKGEFAAFWKKAHGTDGAKLPTVDFSQNYVIAVFGGDMAVPGSKVSIEKISETSEARSVAVVLEEPAPACVTSNTGSSPYIFVTVPFSNVDNLAHTDKVVVGQCQQS